MKKGVESFEVIKTELLNGVFTTQLEPVSHIALRKYMKCPKAFNYVVLSQRPVYGRTKHVDMSSHFICTVSGIAFLIPNDWPKLFNKEQRVGINELLNTGEIWG